MEASLWNAFAVVYLSQVIEFHLSLRNINHPDCSYYSLAVVVPPSRAADALLAGQRSAVLGLLSTVPRRRAKGRGCHASVSFRLVRGAPQKPTKQGLAAFFGVAGWPSLLFWHYPMLIYSWREYACFEHSILFKVMSPVSMLYDNHQVPPKEASGGQSGRKEA